MSNETPIEPATSVQATRQEPQDGRLTIRLTDRQPVRIKETDWTLAAEAVMPLYRKSLRKADCDLQDAIRDVLEAYPNSCEEYPSDYLQIPYTLHVIVRKHADGRSLIYGVRKKNRDAQQALSDEVGGELVADKNEFIEALNRCAKQFIDSCGGCCPEAYQCLVEECLSKLPPQCIDEETPKKSDTGVVVLDKGQPIKISSAVWPLLSEAKEPFHFQAIEPRQNPEDGRLEDEVILMPFGHERLVVRQHATGKTLVYGYTRYDLPWAAQFNIFNPRGGEILPAGSDVASAVKRIGTTLGLQADTIRACINGLPTQDLD
jgi:hypothetical protein